MMSVWCMGMLMMSVWCMGCLFCQRRTPCRQVVVKQIDQATGSAEKCVKVQVCRKLAA